jgi:hypothetical protein
MKYSRLLEIIEEEIYAALAELEGSGEVIDEKSVPEPYDRKVGSPGPKPRKMTPTQVARREKVGKAMEGNPKVAARYKKKHGDDWKSYLYAAATNIALRGE